MGSSAPKRVPELEAGMAGSMEPLGPWSHDLPEEKMCIIPA